MNERPFIPDDVDIDFEDDLSQDQINDFLEELTLLTIKHKVMVCASGFTEPFLLPTDGVEGSYVADEDGEGVMFVAKHLMQ